MAVYVMRKAFYNNNGIDTPMAIGINDVTLFSSWRKAENFVKDMVAINERGGGPRYEVYEEDIKSLFIDDIVTKAKTYAQQEYDTVGCRFGYTIVKPKIF